MHADHGPATVAEIKQVPYRGTFVTLYFHNSVRHDQLTLKIDEVPDKLGPPAAGEIAQPPFAAAGVTLAFTRFMNRVWPGTYFGRKGAAFEELLPIAIFKVAPWFEPLLVLGPILALRVFSGYLGIDLDMITRIVLSVLSQIEFLYLHRGGVWLP